MLVITKINDFFDSFLSDIGQIQTLTDSVELLVKQNSTS